MEGIGTTSLWGFSRAIDFQDLYTAHAERDIKDVKNTILKKKQQRRDSTIPLQPLKILLLGASDPRHIIKTVARAGRYQKRDLHFYVIEPHITNLARTIILLECLLGDSDDMGVQEKTTNFLTLYANLHLHPQTTAHLDTLSTKYISTLPTNPHIPLHPTKKITLTTTHLKYREKDDLENVFRFYRSTRPKPVEFPIHTYWDTRLRHYYGIRYDTREGVIDWDYHMKLHSKAPTIDSGAFMRWRMHGMAFPVREASTPDANRCLGSIRILDGVPKWGVWSDVVVGPWMGFGLDCEDKTVLGVENGRRAYGVGEVVERAVENLLGEWERRVVGGEEKSHIEEVIDGNDEREVMIHLLTPTIVPKLPRIVPNGFDHIYIGSTMAHRIPEMVPLLSSSTSSSSSLIVETAKFILDLTPDQIAEFTKRVRKMVEEGGLIDVDVGWKPGKEGEEEGDHLVFGKLGCEREE